MLLIVQIVLTVMAWRKGWGARSLLPLASMFALMVLSALAVGAGSGSQINFGPLGLLFDVLAVIALAIMVRRAPAAGKRSAERVSVHQDAGAGGAAVPQNS